MSRLIPSRRFALVLIALALIMVGSPQVSVHAACEPVYGPNGSQDPALGFSAACTVLEDQDAATVYGPNGSQDPALGFSRDDTDEVEVADGAVYGPNGSQDPAVGFSRDETTQEVEVADGAVYGPNGSQDPALGYARNAPTETDIASDHACTIRDGDRGVTDIHAICVTGIRDASQPWQGGEVAANRTSPHDQAY